MNIVTAVFYNASSAGPDFVTWGLNPGGQLAKKTEGVVVWGPAPEENMAVYRESSTAPGMLSADLYRWRTDGWDFLGEDPNKHSGWPSPPAGAVHSQLHGVDVSTREPMPPAGQKRLAELIAAPRRKPGMSPSKKR